MKLIFTKNYKSLNNKKYQTGYIVPLEGSYSDSIE